MPRKLKSTVSNIKGYDIDYELSQGKTIADVVKFAKRAAKLANNRLYKLEQAGLTSKATTGGIKHIDLVKITDKYSAARAISKARSLLANPLSTPGLVHKLYREAEAEYGKAGRLKIIAVEEHIKKTDAQGNEIDRIKLVPKAVPYGTNTDSLRWTDVSKALKNFWTWYEKIGQNYLTISDKVYDIWVDSNYSDKEAIKMAEKMIEELGNKAAQDYADARSTLFGESRWF